MAQKESRKRKSKVVNASKRLCTGAYEFGQKPPSLKDFIKTTLNNYPDGSQILKEIIQNADDAKASEVAFLLDYSTHPCENLVNENFRVHQGHALYAWNNAKFTELDWKGIGGTLGNSVKKEETLKVGRFGLGFVAVYHITDLPTILSDDSIGILDPHENISQGQTGIKFELSEFFKKKAYSGHHDSFVSYFGYDGGAIFNGTLFRFPLRDEHCDSDIKPTGLYDADLVMSSLFEPLKKEAENILIFLKNVESIKLYIRRHLKRKIECIFTAKIPTSVHVKRFKFDILSHHIKSCEFKTKIKVSLNSFPIQLSDPSSKEVWLVLNLIGFPLSPNELSKFYYAHKLDYLPWIGIALKTGINNIPSEVNELTKLNCIYDWDGSDLLDFVHKIVTDLKCQFDIPNSYSLSPNSGRMFCFLPSPEDSHFPFHMHGYFALSNDRRRIKWPTLDSRDTDSNWNKLLVEELGVSAYVILNQVMIHCFRHPDPEKYHYQLMGVGAPNQDSLAGILVNQGLGKLIKSELLYSSYSGQWLEVGCESALYHPIVNREDLPSEKSILHVLKLLRQSYVSLPSNLIEIFNSLPPFTACIENNIISPDRLRDVLKEHCDDTVLKFLSFTVINEVLSYILTDIDLNFSEANIARSLHNIPLLVSESNEVCKFSTNSYNSLYIYKSKHNYIDLFPGLEDQFVNRSLHVHNFLLTFSRSYPGRINITDISNLKNNPNLTVLLFKSSLTKSFNSCDGPLDWNSNSNSKIDWIKSVWSFIGANHDLVKSLGELPLLPKWNINSAKNKLLPIKTDSIYIESSPPEYRSIENLLTSSGCVFIHPHRFIECFRDFVTEPLPRGLLLTLRDRDVLDEFVSQLETKTNSTLVHSIVNILTSELSLTPEQIAIIKQLPIFPNMSGRYIPLSNAAVRIPDKLTLPPMTYPEYFLSPDHNKVNELYNCLNFQGKHLNAFVENDLIKFMNTLKESRKFSDHYSLSQMLLGILNRFSPKIISLLKGINWIVDSNAKSVIAKHLAYNSPNKMFSPDDEILKIILPSSSRFFPNSAYRNYFHHLKLVLNDSSRPADQSLFEELIKAAVQNFDYLLGNSVVDCQSQWRRQFITLLRYTTSPSLEISGTVERALSDKKFVLPCYQKPSKYPKCLPFLAEKSFYQLSSVVFCHEEELRMIASVRECVTLFSTKSEFNQFKPLLRRLDCQVELTSEMVIEQLRSICEAEIEKSDKEKVHRILNQIYSSQIIIPEDIDENFDFIYLKSENAFIHPNRLARESLKFPLEPYFYYFDTLNYGEDAWQLFEECGASQSISTKDLYEILKQMYDEEINSVDVVISIIEYLDKSSFQGCEFLPGLDCKLHLAAECVFSDTTNPNTETNQTNIEIDEKVFHIVHFKIPVSVARSFGARSLKFTLLGDEDKFKFCVPVGQSEPLTTRLRNILSQYESSIDVFKEMVQNADDARASAVKILFDHSTYPSKSLLDPSMEAWQGPALYFYNDSQFTEEDFANIMKIFGQTKLESLDKIGKFGLGFNTVYHLTDLPSFVSGRYIHMLDPHMKYIAQNFSQAGIAVDFINKNASVHMYKDQFSVFNVFKCDVFSKKLFQGTLFRLPFRKKTVQSEISENKYVKKKIQDLLTKIVDESESMIRFLQHVECIEVFQRQSTASKEVKLVKVIKKVNSNPLDHPFLIQHSQYFNKIKNIKKILQGDHVDPISHTQDITISKEQEKTRKSEKFRISYASGTKQCLDYIRNSEQCVNYPFCSVLMPISMLSPSPSDSQRIFNLYSFLPLPITAPYHRYYVNGCFDLDASRRGLTVTEDDSDKTRWNQSLINDALVNALLNLLLSVREHFSDDPDIIKYYELWPHERDENSILWRDFPLEFALRAMETNLPVFYYELGDVKWKGYQEVSFIREEDCYDHEPSGQFWDLIKEIALRSNIYLVKIPEEFENSHVFQKIYDNRSDKVCTLQSICETILCSHISDINLEQLKLVLRTLLPLVNLEEGGWCKEFLSESECIPCGSELDYSLVLPSRVVCEHSLVAELYYPADKRTIHPDFGDLMVKRSISYKALKELNMINNVLPCDDLIERCECQVGYSTSQREQHCKTLVQYLNSKVGLTKKKYSKTELERIGSVLLDLEFLPVWGNELLIKLDMQDAKTFASPNECFPFSLRHLIPDNLYAITEEIDELIEQDLKKFLNLEQTQYTLDLEDIVSLLESLHGKETEIIELKLQKLVALFCERIFCVLFERWKSSETSNEETDENDLPLNERLYIWHPTHEIFSDLSELVSTQKYDYCESKYLLSFPYKLSSDPEKEGLFLKSLEIRKDITASVARDTIKKIADDLGNSPVHPEEASLIVDLINSFFGQYEKLTVESKSCLLLSSDMMLCNPSELIIDDLYLEGGKTEKLENDCSIVHGQIHPKCAYNLGAKSIRSKMYTEKPFKVSDFGQHEEITVRIENLKRGYPKGINILKELIQNAEDSEATEMCLLLDYHTYSDKTKTLCFNELEHPSWKEYQKYPSLLVYNNSSFTEEDLEGIQCVGLGGKKNRNTIGKFGLGFNAVYHLTKSPCLITRNPDTGNITLCAMDPYRKFLRLDPNAPPGIRLDFKDKQLSEFYDQFEPYSLFSKIKDHFPALTHGRYSIFRIPLMCSNASEVNELLTELLLYSTKLNLFLDNVHTISVYTHDKTGKVACVGRANTKTSHPIPPTISCPNQYVQNINVCLKEITVETEIPPTHHSYSYPGKRSRSHSKTTTRSWLLFNFTGSIKDLECVCPELKFHKNIIEKEKLTHEVYGGLAVEIPQNETNIGRVESCSLFSYLPIGREGNRNSFPVQVNAPFILESERQYIRFSDTSRQPAKVMEWEDVWHAAILEHVITPLFASLLLSLKQPSHHSELKQLYARNRATYYEWYYSMYPDLTSMLEENNPKMDFLLALSKHLYSLLYQKNERILIERTHTEWYPLTGPQRGVFKCDPLPSETVPTNSTSTSNHHFPQPTPKVLKLSISKVDSFNEDLFSILSKLKYPLTCAPPHIATGFVKFRFEIKRLEQKHFLTFINDHKSCLGNFGTFPVSLSDSKLTKSEIYVLLTYLFKASNETIECYGDIPLKIDYDGKLNVFTKTSVSLFPDYATLLPHLRDVFICSDFSSSLFKQLSTYGYVRTLDSKYLSGHLQSDGFNLEQVSLFWKFILESKTPSHDIIQLFGRHSLVPVQTQGLSNRFLQIKYIPSILKSRKYQSQNCVYKSLVKLNCYWLHLEKFSGLLTFGNISDLEKYLNPLLIPESISAEFFLKAVKLSNNHSLQTVYFEKDEAKSLRNLLSSLEVSKLDTESVKIVGSLKIFISDAGALCSIKDFENCFVNEACVPIGPSLKKILNESNLGIVRVEVKDQALFNYVSKQLKITLIKVEGLFSNYIIRNFNKLNMNEQKNLLNFIYKTTDSYRANIVNLLRNLKFITKHQSSAKCNVSEFYSPTVKLFKLFFANFILPNPWFDKDEGFFRLFCEMGMVHKESLKLVVVAARQVQDGSFHPGSEEVTTVLSVLVSLLKQNIFLNSQDTSHLTELASISFLPGWKINPSKSGLERDLVTFKEANFSEFQDSCCTTSYIHHDQVSQLSELSSAAKRLCIPSEPQTETVVRHLETISKSFSQMIKFHNHRFPQLFYSTYKHMQEKAKKTDLVTRFKETPCLLYENVLYYPRNMVFSLDSILMQYLFKVPDSLNSYKKFLEMVGVEESPTYSHYSSVLADIKNDPKLDDEERKDISKKTFLLFIESLRNFEALNSKIYLNSSKSLVLTDRSLIASVDQVVYLDNTRLKIHMQDFNDLSQLLFLHQLPPNKLGSSEPPAALKVVYLSNIIQEKFEQSIVVASPNKTFCKEGVKIEKFLKTPDFIKGLCRIYYHKTKGRGKGNLNLIRIKDRVAKNIDQDPGIKGDPSFKTVYQTLQDISIRIVDSIPIIITNLNTQVKTVKNDIYLCFFQDSILYAKGGKTSDINFFIDLTYCLNLYLGNIFSDFLFSLELCLSSFDRMQIMSRLDSYDISPCPYLDEIEIPPSNLINPFSQINPLPSSSLVSLTSISPSAGVNFSQSNLINPFSQMNPLPSSSLVSPMPINPSAGITRNNLIQIMHTPKHNIETISKPKGPISIQDELTAKLWIRTAQCDLRAAQKLLSKANGDTTFPPHACANCFECAMKACIAILYINKYNEANLFCIRNLDMLLDLVKNFFPPASFDQFSSHCIPLINFDESAKNPCMTPGIGCCIPMDFISHKTAQRAVENASKLLEILRVEIPVFGELMFDDDENNWESPSVSLLMTQLENFDILSTKTKESLSYESDEYSSVALNFFKTLPNATINNIFKIHNKVCWDQFVRNVKSKVESPGGVECDESSLQIKPLFHGTSETDPDVIIQDPVGFNMSFSHQGMWGKGLYFAVNASYSDKKYAYKSNDGTRSLFLAKVFVGNSRHRKDDRKINGPPKGYHSVTGLHPGGTEVYILYENGLAYPGYLIQYTI